MYVEDNKTINVVSIKSHSFRSMRSVIIMRLETSSLHKR